VWCRSVSSVQTPEMRCRRAGHREFASVRRHHSIPGRKHRSMVDSGEASANTADRSPPNKCLMYTFRQTKHPNVSFRWAKQHRFNTIVRPYVNV
jgi:hypothetical protein